MNRIVKKIELKHKGKNFIITHSYQNGSTSTIVEDSSGVEYPRQSRIFLREKAKQLGLYENGYLYNDGIEVDTHTYFRNIHKITPSGLKQGGILNNSDLYNVFKCGNSGGMRKSNTTNSLLIISDHTKSLYDDRWEEDVLYYTGMGQTGDQSLEFMQNKTLNESGKNGITVYLFEVFNAGEYTFRGEIKLVKNPFQEEQNDADGNSRRVWIFPLKLKTVEKEVRLKDLKNIIEKRENKIRKLSDEQLIKNIANSRKVSSKRNVETTTYERNQHVVEYAKRRAKGKCELCEEEAPFLTKDKQPYLEVHHIQWLSNGGEDSITNVAALCPNCHRKMHALDLEIDKSKLNEKVKGDFND
ncbi:HNH endonuclease [Ilyobacter polytropus]|uniref:HNH endonuclease n=1 Tax=Ilyobacter polytropus (strain ATCC 51220 / DSM 2926 / LMG 16218 / CuHBu1) TaxID=572544 RepID=E3H995_ILYPC|nr:HNH endonuclease signature motif containing protein [Ilyobacter polytropus]ADO82794.1 HNH endonuclease [Ilyobacter polytropus DSM 2926]